MSKYAMPPCFGIEVIDIILIIILLCAIFLSGCAGTKASIVAEGRAEQNKPATASARAQLTWSR